jgi:diguanylate cyclase (GGDEF)-like protein/PAS domain S-box-containing protein
MTRKKGVVRTVTPEFPVRGSRAQIIGLTRRLFTTATVALAAIALTSVAFVLVQGRGEIIAVISVLAEIVVLVVVLSDLKRRIIGQTAIVHDQQRALANQATRLRQQAKELQLSNEDLRYALSENQRERRAAEEAAAEQQAFFSAMTDVIVVLGRDGECLKIAPTTQPLLYAPASDLLGRRIPDVLPAETAKIVMNAIKATLSTRQKIDVEYDLTIGDRPLRFAASVTALGNDRVLWVARDITSGTIAAEALRESEMRFRNLVELSPQGIALHSEGRLIYANAATSMLFGVDGPSALRGEMLLDFVEPAARTRLAETFANLQRDGGRAITRQCQFVRREDDARLDVEVTSVAVTHDGKSRILSLMNDVTERNALEAQLAHQAFHDPLTNLANRALFRDRVEHAAQRAVRAVQPPVVLFLDLDNFKSVNDGLGHSAGDRLLIEVAARLSGCLRSADTVARLGGDEFAILLEDVPTCEDADAAVARILDAFTRPFSVQGTDLVATASIGIANASAHESADDVLRNADLALYRAKGAGKAQAASFEPAMHTAARSRLELETQLRRAIEGDPSAGRLLLHYQPLLWMATGELAGFEALVRWEHMWKGLLRPLDFVSLAEETGLIVPLGQWVLTQACSQIALWSHRYPSSPLTRPQSLRVSVNLSGRHLAQPDLVRDVAAALSVSGLEPGRLVLEMTESMLVHDNRATLERLQSLRALGVGLSIDDFGTGYSSLSYLESFPVDSLKMDRSFIVGITRDQGRAPLAQAVVALGRTLGLRVVAEGIETPEQWTYLRDLGCDLGQGFLMSKPIPAEELEAVFEGKVRGLGGRANPWVPLDHPLKLTKAAG